MPADEKLADTVYRCEVTVDAPIDLAFEVFTDGFDSWWPRDHHIGAVDMAEAIIEPRRGGKWYERGVDGSTCEWGSVLAWDPPRHLAVAWHLNGEFQYDPDPQRASRVDIRFSEDGPGRTTVRLEHSELDRHGPSWPQLYEGVGSANGWPLTLECFKARLHRT